MISGIVLFIVLAAILIACHKSGLRRLSSDQVFGGVCSGIAAKLEMTPALVRVLTVLALLLTGGIVALLYILLWLSLPQD